MSITRVETKKKPWVFTAWLRKVYDWILHWSETPYGPAALFVLAFAEASVFPIPPDPLLIALVLGSRRRAFRLAGYCATGSVLGAVVGYLLGHWLWWANGHEFTPLAQFFFHYVPGFTRERFLAVQSLYNQWNFWVVFTAGFTPLPYKVFTIAGGALKINFLHFFIASVVGRSARFFLISALIWKFGAPIQHFIDRYFNWLVIGFTGLLLTGFLVIKLIL
ncbi:MAG: DedA family protein [Calditrichaeota bacterium]|nr:MAG: DedA family protein [Calditrichota bacterium]